MNLSKTKLGCIVVGSILLGALLREIIMFSILLFIGAMVVIFGGGS